MDNSWQQKISEYCAKYSLPLIYLAETLYDPKVIPMIRGKGFEFSAMLVLKKILPEDEWEVSKPMINAQTGLHDIDVRVIHKPSQKIIAIECKLAKKGGYRSFPDGRNEIRIKCMRSRTLGPGKVKQLAPQLGIDEKILAIHNDQYLPSDFDVVISSIGNAFYETDKKTGFFEWAPTASAIGFLQKLNIANHKDLKNFAFNKMYIAQTKDLTIAKTSGVICTRSKCKNKKKCGFIPNYPVIKFDPKTNKPINGWVPVEESLPLFRALLQE